MTSSSVIDLVSPARVERAWRDYAREAARIPDNPDLLSDREFMEGLVRLEREWKRLFMAMECPGEVIAMRSAR